MKIELTIDCFKENTNRQHRWRGVDYCENHRRNRPAVINKRGAKFYYLHHLPHNAKGPAAKGSECFYLAGILMEKEDWLKIKDKFSEKRIHWYGGKDSYFENRKYLYSL